MSSGMGNSKAGLATPGVLHTSSGEVSKVSKDTEPEPNIISEIEGWRMTPADDMLIPYMYNTCSVLSHYCEKIGWRQWMSPDDVINNKVCPSCFEDVPEGVLAVWHLYNANEISKYAEKIRSWAAQDKGERFTEDPYIYKDSKPLLDITLFEDPEGNLYKSNGELYESEEMSKWNGTEPNVLLFSYDDTPICGEDEPAYKMEATGAVI